ncbi:MAG TPA: peptidylprolyl isomerase [Verrucomicrobiae bacterium]|nr:peptidylprolyl isomerase [Verrucomicrobiae bacterium]
MLKRTSLVGLAVAGVAAGAIVLTSGLAVAADAPAWKSQAGKYAVFDTTEGKIVCVLFEKEAPKTVENFTGLATGTKEFKDAATGSQAKRPFYDGTKFHRIIPGFMMQGGDPLGTGTGGPGYTIDDEFAPSLNFSEKGKLAMARTPAPHSAGSQFFITTAPTTFLNGGYAIFGKVVEGQDVVDRICATIGSQSGKPTKDVVIRKLTIETVAGK